MRPKKLSVNTSNTFSSKVLRGRRLIRCPRGVARLAGAATLHHHVVLPCQRDGAQRDHQEQVRRERLLAAALQDIAAGGRALVEDDLLQEVGELLHDGDALARGEAGAPHGRGGVELGGAQLGRGRGGAAL